MTDEFEASNKEAKQSKKEGGRSPNNDMMFINFDETLEYCHEYAKFHYFTVQID